MKIQFSKCISRRENEFFGNIFFVNGTVTASLAALNAYVT